MGPHKQYNLPSRKEQNSNQGNRIGQDFVSAPNVTRTDKDLVVKDYYIFNNIESALLKGQRFGRIPINPMVSGAVYSVTTTDFLVGITNLVLAPTIGLPKPSLAGVGKTYTIKDEAGGAASTTITVVSAGEETIDGASSSTITANFGSKKYYTDGANWFTH